jgi:hypothetical protein
MVLYFLPTKFLSSIFIIQVYSYHILTVQIFCDVFEIPEFPEDSDNRGDGVNTTPSLPNLQVENEEDSATAVTSAEKQPEEVQ